MTELGHLSVRHPATTFAKVTTQKLFREVGAPLLSRRDVSTKDVRVEWMQRLGSGQVKWHYRQDRHAVFCFGAGVQSCRGLVDGRPARAAFDGSSNLAFVAAGSTVDAVFEVPAKCSYMVASFACDFPAGIDDSLTALGVPESQMGFADPKLTLIAAQLRRELAQQDAVSRLMVESWAAQAWGLLLRRTVAMPGSARGLGKVELARILRTMRDRIARDLSVADLAGSVGLSPRQFYRRFLASTGTTPGRMMERMRLDAASALLTTTDRKITEIALDCGFSQPQHLATALKRRYGITPSAFRAAGL